MGQLLRESAEVATSALNAAEYMPDFAADFIEVSSIRIQSPIVARYMPIAQHACPRVLSAAVPVCAVAARLDGSITGTWTAASL